MRLSFRLLLRSSLGLYCCLGIAACSGSIDRDVLKEETLIPASSSTARRGGQSPRGINRQLAKVPRTQQRSPLPLRVAVHMYESQNSDWRWSARDRGKLASWGRELRKQGIVESMFVMSNLVSTGNSIEDIRLAATKHGADTVLVVKAGAELDTGWNPLALFYLTGVGYYIFPGSSADALMVARGVLVDVMSGQTLLTIEVEGSGSTMAPGGFLDPQRAVQRAKAQTLERFRDVFLNGTREYARRRASEAKSRDRSKNRRPRSLRRNPDRLRR